MRISLAREWRPLRSTGVAVCLALIVTNASPASADESAETLLAEAAALYNDAATAPETLIEIREILDRIVGEYPASDIAVQILLRRTVGGLDIATIEKEAGAVGTGSVPDVAPGAQECLAEAMAGRVEARITLTATINDKGRIAGLPSLRAPSVVNEATRRTFSLAMTAIDGCTPFEKAYRGQEIEVALAPDGAVELDTAIAPPAGRNGPDTPPLETLEKSKPVAPPVGTKATMDALDFAKPDIRDLQARLLVAGHDPKGIDGLIGPGTRTALRAWQADQGIAANGFLNDAQLELLTLQTQEKLASWLEDPRNAALHTPPSPIALGPGNLSGTWRFTTSCGPNSKLGQRRITGVVSLQHVSGSAYTGTVQNSQGLRGQFSGHIRGREYQAEVNYGFFFGTVRVTGRIADHSLIVRGRDSNGCSFYSEKG